MATVASGGTEGGGTWEGWALGTSTLMKFLPGEGEEVTPGDKLKLSKEFISVDRDRRCAHGRSLCGPGRVVSRISLCGPGRVVWCLGLPWPRCGQ